MTSRVASRPPADRRARSHEAPRCSPSAWYSNGADGRGDRSRARRFLAAYAAELRDIAAAARRPGFCLGGAGRVLLGSNEFIYLD